MKACLSTEEVRLVRKEVPIKIHYLGGVLSLEIGRKCLGMTLFNTVVKILDVRNGRYFGLQYEDDKGRPRWLKRDRRVIGQVREGRPLFFLVRFYPESIAEVEVGGDLSLVYRQAKEAVMSGAVYCPPELSLLLGSYALQAEYGDRPPWESIGVAAVVPRQARLARSRLSDRAWLEAVRSWHNDHRGLSPSRATSEYLRLAQTLSMYAVSYFPVTWMNARIYLGVCPAGINLYYDSNFVTPKVSLRWVLIKHLRCSCKSLTVRPMVSSVPDYIFNLEKRRTLKQIYSMAVGYFKIYRRKKMSGPPPQLQPESTASYETISSDNSSKERLPAVEEHEEEITTKEVLIQ